MTLATKGIHHITAFATDPQGIVDFYAGVLGLRMVKKTINFDAPEVYHLYFGDEHGSPGTILTFFPHPGSRKGRVGGGQVGMTTLAVPPGSMGFWEERLARFGVDTSKAVRFGEELLQFADREGMLLEIVEREQGPENSWSFGGVPSDKAVKGFGGALLYSTNSAATRRALTDTLGLKAAGESGGFARFIGEGELGNIVDVPLEDVEYGSGGAGTVHHIAWRAKDFAEHEQWRAAASAGGFQPTPVIDRQYFNAVYFRESGGILFEIATDPPGFAVDEAEDQLGAKLMLPDWYEPHRGQIEAGLLPITVRSLGEE
ncbi:MULTISPECIES: ring-cleaving dioxygenase [unclassified Paenibacillus]|uniref:ring-cleaving dioxygenase n=1 Tax=unclassified Paenibacillus TaxID=185978 RepID=UPI000954C011|nr:MULTISPECIES: ring-cleaving dioxygenase [unclassified Paenibacillus]ASS68335.1 ring-cleaving dioxygenase [Paenibacillus sp. RUD330]SIR29416.1 glyoxalase family protein [Paenibacillus sp. RU4X]SIR41525.1 glyoxalase family protein [Paenibacillus sp. RU4T]